MIWEQFTHLGNFPPELKARFNSFLTTEFDDSLSVEMQLRSIIKWCQENFKTVDTLIDFINDISNWLKQFENNFDTKLEDSVISILSEWQASGQLDVVISEALQWQLDDYIATNEQDKLSLTEQLQQTSRKQMVSVTDFGAKGDYNPDTEEGTDDTIAFQTALNSLKSFQRLLIPEGIYKITSPLTTKKQVYVEGEGWNSIIWGEVGAANDLISIPKDPSGLSFVDLKNFAILGKENAGNAALNIKGIGFSNVDVYIGGHYKYMMYCYDADGFYKGGIECSDVRLTVINHNTQFNFNYIPPRPTNGLWLDGYANASVFDLHLSGVNGHGLYVKGSYASANTSTFKGNFQGMTSSAIKVEGSSLQTVFDNIYTEAVGSPAIDISGLFKGEIINAKGSITLSNSKYTKIKNSYGQTIINSTCENIVVEDGVADGNPLTNLSNTTVTKGYRQYSSVSDARADTGLNDNATINTILNGNTIRFDTNIAKQLWGTNANSNFIATKCGVGLVDTTHTSQSDYSALIEEYPGNGNSVLWDIFKPNELKGYEGNTVWGSMKVKTIQGKASAQIIASNQSMGYSIPIDNTRFPEVENGFIRVMVMAKVTSEIATNGIQLRLHVPTLEGVKTKAYVSEIMGGLGTNVPKEFISHVGYGSHQSKFSLKNGRLTVYADAMPTTGGEPILGRRWLKGDYVVNNSPSINGTTPNRVVTKGWIRLTEGNTHVLYTDWFPDNSPES